MNIILSRKLDFLTEFVSERKTHKQALQVRTRDAFPEQWAQTQANLGSAYLFRIREDRAENLEKAITFYKNALQVYSYEGFP